MRRKRVSAKKWVGVFAVLSLIGLALTGLQGWRLRSEEDSPIPVLSELAIEASRYGPDCVPSDLLTDCWKRYTSLKLLVLVGPEGVIQQAFPSKQLLGQRVGLISSRPMDLKTEVIGSIDRLVEGRTDKEDSRRPRHKLTQYAYALGLVEQDRRNRFAYATAFNRNGHIYCEVQAIYRPRILVFPLPPALTWGIVSSFLLYWFLVPLWVYLDARQKNGRAPVWGFLCLFTNVVGLLSYLLAQSPPTTTCTRCGRLLRPEFNLCPYCGPVAFQNCPECQAKLEVGWRWCPYCHASLERLAKAMEEMEEEG